MRVTETGTLETSMAYNMAYKWDNLSMITREQRFPDTEEVIGSIPVSPTRFTLKYSQMNGHVAS